MRAKLAYPPTPQVPVRVHFDDDDAPVEPITHHTYTGRPLRVKSVRLDYEARNGVWECRLVHAEGTVLRENGRPFRLEGKTEWGRGAAPGRDLPDWAQELADHYRPSTPVPVVTDEVFVSRDAAAVAS